MEKTFKSKETCEGDHGHTLILEIWKVPFFQTVFDSKPVKRERLQCSVMILLLKICVNQYNFTVLLNYRSCLTGMLCLFMLFVYSCFCLGVFVRVFKEEGRGGEGTAMLKRHCN